MYRGGGQYGGSPLPGGVFSVKIWLYMLRKMGTFSKSNIFRWAGENILKGHYNFYQERPEYAPAGRKLRKLIC